jgi:hypothetical protein
MSAATALGRPRHSAADHEEEGMANDDEVTRLLTEIRDLQRQQIEAYGRALENQQDAIRMQREAVARTRRFLRGVGVIMVLVLVIVLVLLRFVLRHYA